MAEVLRTIVTRVELRPLGAAPDPVVLRSVTLAPKHGVRVRVERLLTAATAHQPAAAAR